jgi:glycosyltransferase involved in cell wall biosynthesis
VAGRWTTTLVCVSGREAADADTAGITADRRVVPNAVDLRRFEVADETDRRRARARLGLGQAPLAVCVGRLGRQKGQDVLVDAWPVVRAAVPDAELALVGDGPARAALARTAGAGVSFVGERSDVAVWLAASDVVVLPSRWEGMSYVMLEAMATGRSVVASDVGGAGEAIAGGPQRAGALVPPNDPGALTTAVVERLSDPELAAAEGREGARRARANHDLTQWCEIMKAVALEALGTSAVSPSV